MEYQTSEWNGFRRLDFTFEERGAVAVLPEKTCAGGKWLFKTEYFGAFPSFEIEMLKRGYHLFYIKNISRWCLPDDIDVKARFSEFIIKEFSLNARCMPVGMSCGGMHAVYFAAKYPEYTAALYLDAPVLNLLSCPCGVGNASGEMYLEFARDTGMSVSELINYRNHPIDNVPRLLENHIPVFLVCGDSDNIVPYSENGAVLEKMYNDAGGVCFKVLKEGCGHHPHGPADLEPLIRFTEEYYR